MGETSNSPYVLLTRLAGTSGDEGAHRTYPTVSDEIHAWILKILDVRSTHERGTIIFWGGTWGIACLRLCCATFVLRRIASQNLVPRLFTRERCYRLWRSSPRFPCTRFENFLRASFHRCLLFAVREISCDETPAPLMPRRVRGIHRSRSVIPWLGVQIGLWDICWTVG